MPGRKSALIALMVVLVGLTGLQITSCGITAEHDLSEPLQEQVEMAPDQPVENHIHEEQAKIEAERGTVDQGTIDQRVDDPALRHVIRRGSIDLTVKDSRTMVQEIRDIVKDFEGIVSNSYLYEIREGQYGARMTLRIPEKHFEAVLDQLETLGKVTNIQTELEDVTMQYVDLESRLNNQKAQEERLTEILEMAETVEEVLEVEKELYRIRGEIESMSARLTRLEDQITYSTINISLREETIPTETISPAVFQNLGSRIAQAFIGGTNFILNAVSVLIVVLSALIPALIIIVIIGVIIFLFIRRHIKHKAITKKSGQEQN